MALVECEDSETLQARGKDHDGSVGQTEFQRGIPLHDLDAARDVLAGDGNKFIGAARNIAEGP